MDSKERFRLDMITWLQRMDANGLWSDEDNADEGYKPITVEEGIEVATRWAKDQVSADINKGVVPADVKDFAKLHEFVDANYYGGAFEWPTLVSDMDSVTQDQHVKFWNAVQSNVDAWLKAGRSDEAKPAQPKVYPGIWTPWAEVLCYECHGPTFRTGHANGKPIEKYAEMCLTVTNEPKVYTRCDSCGKNILIERPDVTELAHLRDAINGRMNAKVCRLDQTGGMCCAVNVPLGGDAYLLLTSSDDGEGKFGIGEYKNADDDGKYNGEEFTEAVAVAYVEARLIATAQP